MIVEVYGGGSTEVMECPSPKTETLYTVCDMLSRRKRYDSILEYILTSLIRATKSKYGSIAVSRKKSGKYVLKCITNTGSFTCQNGVTCKDVDQCGIFGLAYRKNKVIISNDVGADPRSTKPQLPPGHPIVQKFMAVPITYHAKSIGVLALADADSDYTTVEVSMVVQFSSIIGGLIQKCYLQPRNMDLKSKKEVADVKDHFLATMSHELRTPLNGIVGMVSMLQDAGELNAKQKEYVAILMECSHQLMNLMNNILDFSKISVGCFVLARNPFDIYKAISNAVIIVEGRARSKNLPLVTDIKANIPTLIGDSQRLTQILTNLLSNAIKFTEKGSVTLKVWGDRIKHDSDDVIPKWRVNFEITDTGVGISSHDQENIFTVFHQVRASKDTDFRDMTHVGTGLGLSITKELVKLMGGSIHVSSQGLGHGSVFSFDIIAEEEVSLDHLKNEYSSLFSGTKILVVDDRVEYRLALTSMLFRWGCTPIVVSSGEEALAYLSHDTDFGAVIIDMCMPYMSGIELAQEIRIKYPQLRLIALSSIETTSGRELFDHYMNKPVDQNLLLPVLVNCLTNRGSPRKPISTPLRHTKKTKNDLKILIVEDDKNNAYTLREMLHNLGYNLSKIKTVDNGEKCVRTVKRHSYDVVLMDIVMPVMDGLEATKHIRQLPNPPYIIAVSAAVHNSDKQRCQSVGIDGYLSKPILKDRLDAALQVVIAGI